MLFALFALSSIHCIPFCYYRSCHTHTYCSTLLSLIYEFHELSLFVLLQDPLLDQELALLSLETCVTRGCRLYHAEPLHPLMPSKPFFLFTNFRSFSRSTTRFGQTSIGGSMYKGNTWQSSSKGQRWTHRYKNLLIEIASSGRSASNCSTLSNKSLDTSRMRQNPQHFRLCFLSPGSPWCCAFSFIQPGLDGSTLAKDSTVVLSSTTSYCLSFESRSILAERYDDSSPSPGWP